MDKLSVIQADIDFAANILRRIGRGLFAEHHDAIVAEAAAHRIASQAELVEVLNSIPVDDEFANSELFRAAVNNWWDSDVAPTLEALSHTKGEAE